MSSSNHHPLLAATLLLTFLAAASASGPTWCVPGLAIPHNPLQSCPTYVVSRTCSFGPYLPTAMMKERCYRELDDITAYCRCGALRILMDSVITLGGQHEGRLPDLPGCPREVQQGFAAILVTEAECNLSTIHGGPYCLSLGAGPGFGV